jgi:hypothetical protein
MQDPVKFAARFLAYSWFRRNYPHASHQRAWKFSGENWNAFLLQALENRTEAPRRPRPLVPIR